MSTSAAIYEATVVGMAARKVDEGVRKGIIKH